MQFFQSRREIKGFLLGLLSGGALVALGVGLFLNRDRAVYSPEVLPEYAYHTCAEAAPPLKEGVQAWVANPRPPLGGFVRFCARFIQNGALVSAAEFRPTLSYVSPYGDKVDSQFGTYTDTGGILDTSIMNLSDPGLNNPIDIEIQISPDSSWENSYTAHASFMYEKDYLIYPPPEEMWTPNRGVGVPGVPSPTPDRNLGSYPTP